MLSKENLSDAIWGASEGLLIHLSDLALYTLAFGLGLASAGYDSRRVYQAAAESSDLIAQIDYASFRRTLYYLRQKGLTRTITDKANQFVITSSGKKRLSTKFPTYLEKRPWDGKIYLVTYDVEETNRAHRDILREQLHKLGCALLQKSVYVSVYDPRTILRDWAKENRLEGSVIVSDVGKDGSVAGKTISELVAELYDLSFVDGRYSSFINKYQKIKRAKVNQWQLNLDWFSCVEKDPQLPFELLPRKFEGAKAHKLYQKLTQASPGPYSQSRVAGNNYWHHHQQKYLREQQGKWRSVNRERGLARLV